MTTEQGELPDLDAWRPNQMQLIVFPMTPPVSTTQDWWGEVVGQEPTETVKRPHEKTETGSLADVSLTLTTDLLKIAWTMTPRIDPDNPPVTIPMLSPFPESRDRFVELMRPWVSTHFAPIKRLGFATFLIQDARSHADAYRLLGLYLPTVEVDPESFDFTYRVNRRRPSNSGIPDLSINRVAVWSAAKFSSVLGAVTLGSPIQLASLPVSQVQYKAMLSLDVNSDLERVDPLPQANQGRLFDELVELASQIATFGDLK
jgi:hypothetical protein